MSSCRIEVEGSGQHVKFVAVLLCFYYLVIWSVSVVCSPCSVEGLKPPSWIKV